MKSNPKTLLISANDEKKIFKNNLSYAVDIVEYALKKDAAKDTFLPDKISYIIDNSIQNRINCMPAALLSDKLYGVKVVSVFPENPKKDYRNVTGTTILSDLSYGHTLSIMDSGYLTDIRTAAVGATAAKYLSKKDSESIGFIGAGQQARRHLDIIMTVRHNIKKCYVSSRTDNTVQKFIEEEKILHPDLEFINCENNYEQAVINSDIIVTAISGQADLLKAKWIKNGALYIHVAGLEDEYAVSLSASKIVCDQWDNVKHRTQTISRMYKEGILRDKDIYGNLVDIVTNKIKGRENDEEFIYFCSVGLAFIDVAFAKYVYENAQELKLGTKFAFN
ncbi:MAG: ornithine cyclodeaminase family protein [Mollicutes bacterium]|nr:ornithine cyclodeaminase family protein [Mollicutes bacterium]